MEECEENLVKIKLTTTKYSYKEVILPWGGRAYMAVRGKEETAATQVT